MTATEGMDQFPEPTPTPRMYRLTTPDHREEDANAWMKFGACNSADPEAFFPDKGGSSRAAKKVCDGCDVEEQCLQYALDNDEHFGMWGGLSEHERRKLRSERHRRRAGAA
jgi:WhiB family redox-sensing transcriptional regulator